MHLKSVMHVKSLKRCAFILATLMIAACASKAPPKAVVIEELPNAELEALMADTDAAIEGEQFRNALPLLQQIQLRPLTPQQVNWWAMNQAEVSLALADPDSAWSALQQIDRQSLAYAPLQAQIRHGLLRAQYFEARGDFFIAARERDFLSGILEDEQYTQNHEQIWHDLMQLPPDELADRVATQTKGAGGFQFSQWVALASIAKDPSLTLNQHLQALQSWRQRHPSHPAATELPGGLSLLEDLARKQPKHIALLLPLSGKLANSGKAVRDGFMAAYFQATQKADTVPTITMIDTAKASTMDDAYANAIALGAELVIGPLSKDNVRALAQAESLPLPTLALNYSDQVQSVKETPDDFYQFGLAAEDEAVLIAERAYLEGHRRALALTPDTEWGERIYTAFEKRWLALGGEIAEHNRYGKLKDYNPVIKSLLNVDDSQRRFRTIRSLLRTPAEFEPRRRQDVDWVFMVSLPKQGRQIRPMFDFNFAANIPVYSTSHIFSGVPQPKRDADLNGIRFTDIPWLVTPGPIRQQVEQAQPKAKGPYARLYAMGADAFRLYPRLQQLAAFPNSQIFGFTGDLGLDQSARIHRKTRFAIFRRGTPKPFPLIRQSES